jgi:tetratricopeptide (TPR) repeat protein
MSWEAYIKDGIKSVRRGQFDAAELSLMKALSLAKENFERSDDRIAMTLSLLGQVYFNKKDFGMAEKLLEQSVRLHAQQESFADPSMFMDLFCLCEIKKFNGAFQQALSLYDQMLPVLKDKKVLDDRLKTEEAVSRLEELLAQCKELAPPLPEVSNEEIIEAVLAGVLEDEAPTQLVGQDGEGSNALTMFNLWQSQTNSGKEQLQCDEDEDEHYVSAYLNFESAWRLARDLFKPEDFRLWSTLSLLAESACRLHMDALSERLYRQAIEGAHMCPSASPADVSTLNLKLAELYSQMDNYRAAESLIEQSEILLVKCGLALNEEQMRTWHNIKDRAKLLSSTADVIGESVRLEAAGQLDKANKLLRSCLATFKHSFPPDHLQIAILLRSRAHVLAKMGSGKESSELMERAERIEKANAKERAKWNELTKELPLPESDSLAVA